MDDTDPRWRELAALLVDRATAVRPGERVLVAMREPETFPLAVHVHEAVVRAGGFPQTILAAAGFDDAVLRLGSDELVTWVPELESLAIDWADVSIWLRGVVTAAGSAGVSPERLALHRTAMGTVSAHRTERTRWTLVRVPSKAFAAAAGLPIAAATELFFGACLIDWTTSARDWRRIADRLARGSHVRISGPGTDLGFSTAGRCWVVGDGRINLPDGEVYTAPVDDSMEGEIAFGWPQTYGGLAFEGVRLRFRRGVVVEATATRGEPELRAILAADAGARLVGEVGLGVNRALTRPFNDPLLDEKIFGTVHLALGRAYAECGGTNRSAIHWDLVQDLRVGGRIVVDGEVVFADGAYRSVGG